MSSAYDICEQIPRQSSFFSFNNDFLSLNNPNIDELHETREFHALESALGGNDHSSQVRILSNARESVDDTLTSISGLDEAVYSAINFFVFFFYFELSGDGINIF